MIQSNTGLEAPLRDVLQGLTEPIDSMTVSVGGYDIRLDDLDLELWRGTDGPRVTKRDFLRYLIRVAPFLLNHLRDRPVELTRCPAGIDGESLFGHEKAELPPFARTIEVWSAEHDEPGTHLLVPDLPTLLWLGDRCAVELFPWLSRVGTKPPGSGIGSGPDRGTPDLESLWFPDFLVVNLDWRRTVRPESDTDAETDQVAFRRVADVALDLRSVATALGLRAFVKTSGRRGLHCYLPLERKLTFSEVRVMAEMVGQFLLAVRPRNSTRKMTLLAETGFISIDHHQNTWGKVLVAPYSLRRHPAVTVSTPLSWSELPTAYPTQFTLHTVPDLLAERGDPWADIVPSETAPIESAPRAEPDRRPSGRQAAVVSSS